MKTFLPVLLTVVHLIAACASYTPQPVTLLRIQSATISGEDQGVAVGVTPHLNEERNVQIFGADLRQAGILPLQVAVRNNSSQRITIRKSDFVFRLAGEHEYAPAPAAAVATRLESSAGVIGWTVAFGLVGFLASSTQQQEANNARRADLQNKEFRDLSLDPQESAQGFLFFLIPDETKEIKDAKLVLTAVEASTNKRINVTLALPDVGVWNERPSPQEK